MPRWFNKNKFHNGNAVKLLQSGSVFFPELESLIKQAKYFIHIQLYIFDDDETGRRIINLLKKTAQKGILIYIVVDGYGSENFPKSTISEMTQAGIFFKIFSPIHKTLKFRIGRRLHHKIILVDGTAALIGGINIAEKYEGSKTETPWLDFAVKISGPICNDILRICESVFKKKERQKFKKLYHHHIQIKTEEPNVSMRLLQNDWVRKNIEISTFYRHTIKHSTQSLVIVASYFLPGNRMRFLLRKAAERGVKITLLLSGKSDVGLMKHAANYLYPFLLRNNIEVYEWTTSVLHGKIMLVDDRLTTVGSYNINALSDYGSLELNVLIDDIGFNDDTKKNIAKLLNEDCQKINISDYKKQQHVYNQIINWFSYQLARTSFKLLFFFMRK